MNTTETDPHVLDFHYRLEPLLRLSDHSVIGYELLAGEAFCPAFDSPGWYRFYAFMVQEIPRILAQYPGLLFVNVSGEQFIDPVIFDLLRQYPADSGRLVLEWTEQSFHHAKMPDVLAAIAKAKRLGYQIAVDDIGAGVDGMGRAIACNPHFGKIDGQILMHAREQAENPHLFMRGMADSLRAHGIIVIAEFIETEADRHIAVAAGVDIGQGYLWTHSKVTVAG
ncbi:EAL domain-containing protein [Acidithiobacillus thiooxidans]|uniref:EAL domain-containing protein n=1 Tax=Acidithiobacillus thiooxidans TaxID=930 RepID=UPI001C06771B|nr:EAL domain-containing protein [Acidithiobacillus thiooxidans]MBU2750145.1 EAL domain-containing protein [Acidithiobacillus thiooxidans]